MYHQQQRSLKSPRQHGIFIAAGYDTIVTKSHFSCDGPLVKAPYILHACPSEQSSPSWGHLTVALQISESQMWMLSCRKIVVGGSCYECGICCVTTKVRTFLCIVSMAIMRAFIATSRAPCSSIRSIHTCYISLSCETFCKV